MSFAPQVRIRIVDFYTKAREKTNAKLFLDGAGKPVYDDWVAYSPIGSKEEVRAPVARLSQLDDAYEGQNPAYAMARARWDYIKPAYDAWKRGEEAPETGTPLSAANFLRKEDVAVIKRNGITTLEDFVDLPEGARDKIQLPRTRDLQRQAKAFLEAQDANKALAELTARDARIAALEARLALLEATPRPIPIEEPPPPDEMAVYIPEKRGPGRPKGS